MIFKLGVFGYDFNGKGYGDGSGNGSGLGTAPVQVAGDTNDPNDSLRWSQVGGTWQDYEMPRQLEKIPPYS